MRFRPVRELAYNHVTFYFNHCIFFNIIEQKKGAKLKNFTTKKIQFLQKKAPWVILISAGYN